MIKVYADSSQHQFEVRHILLFAVNTFNNNDDFILDDDCSLNKNLLLEQNENGNSDTAKNLDNYESRKTEKTASIPSFRIKNTPYLRSIKAPRQLNSRLDNIHASTSSKRCKAKMLFYKL